ncbi:MAG: arabinogalactan endo-1,4-beta-galactosidase [Blautia sp.]|nr:arabinogalactan endo-1,4-beta-galactosidase [Blautia sp.]
MLDFYMGADISSLPRNLDEGMAVRDRDGSETEPFELLKKYGLNSVRLRIWNDPDSVPQAKGYCNLEHTLRMARKIKENGMSFLLDFHYSDFWADPANQRKPKAWEGLSCSELEEAVYSFTRDTLLRLKEEDLLPDMVQIGNEIRSGLLFPEGEVPDYAGMVKLVNAGIRGAREAADRERMQVMIHLDQGGRYPWLHEWFEKAFAAGLDDFDLIGLSYYPFWHGTYLDLRDSMNRLVKDYEKPILIVETAYAWRKSERGFIDEDQIRISCMEATPRGQRRVLEYVMHLVAELPDRMGKGIYYWEPVCVPSPGRGGWNENMGLFDEDGRALEGIEAFRQTRTEMEREPQGWRELEEKLNLAGCAGGTGGTNGENLLRNGDFSEGADGMEHWTVEEKEEGTVLTVHPKTGSLKVQAVRNFRFSISNSVSLEKEGDYGVSVEIIGVDTTGVDVRLFAENAGNVREKTIHPAEHSREVYEIRNMHCEAGEFKVGIRISSPAIYVTMGNFRVIREV